MGGVRQLSVQPDTPPGVRRGKATPSVLFSNRFNDILVSNLMLKHEIESRVC